MSTDRIHRTISADGTRIAGRIQGQGPPLAFVSSALGDDTTSWASVVSRLSDQFTCYLVNTRGRGLSDDAPDHSRDRLVEDISAFVDSIDAPVGLVGHSSAGALALEAAARSAAVGAVAVYEPTLLEFADADFAASVLEGLGRVGSLAEQDRLVEAATLFFTDVVGCPDDELEALVHAGAPQGAAGYVPILLDEAAQSPPGLSDPGVLEHISVPVLVLTGARTDDFWHDVAGELDRRLVRPHVRTVDGVAHFAPLVAPGPVADALIEFFASQIRQISHHGMERTTGSST